MFTTEITTGREQPLIFAVIYIHSLFEGVHEALCGDILLRAETGG